jgi:superfamily II DNA/RNA helicase
MRITRKMQRTIEAHVGYSLEGMSNDEIISIGETAGFIVDKLWIDDPAKKEEEERKKKESEEEKKKRKEEEKRKKKESEEDEKKRKEEEERKKKESEEDEKKRKEEEERKKKESEEDEKKRKEEEEKKKKEEEEKKKKEETKDSTKSAYQEMKDKIKAADGTQEKGGLKSPLTVEKTTKPRAKRTGAGKFHLEGYILLLAIDTIFPLTLSFAHNLFVKQGKIKATDLQLGEKDMTKLEPLADQAAKHLTINMSPVTGFLIASSFMYANNLIALKSK